MTAMDVALYPHLAPESRGKMLRRLQTQARIPVFAGMRRITPDQMRGISKGKPKGR